MLKRILAPIQSLILLQGKCVGCGRKLSHLKKIERGDNTRQITCICGRVFIFDKRRGRYRRAMPQEVKN